MLPYRERGETVRREPVVDAHQHFWDPAVVTYPWLTAEYAAVRRRFGPEDLAPQLAQHGVDRTVLVQTLSSLAETRELLRVAARAGFVAGVVGWVDLADPGVESVLREVRAAPEGRWLVGIRHQAHDEPDPGWLVREDVRRGLRALGDAGLAFDFLVRTRELPAAWRVAHELPEMRFVIDHIAKPPIRTGDHHSWAEAMAPFSDLRNVSCKLSGMITEADWHAWRPDDLIPYVRRVVGWFGEDRLMFGSDWPVCLVAGSYGQVLDTAAATLADLSAKARSKIFGRNAMEFYRLRC